MCQSVGNVPLHVEMRKECEVLKNIANLAFGDGQVEAGLSIEKNAMVHPDAPSIGGCESGDAVQQGRLPFPGWPKPNGEAGRARATERDPELLPPLPAPL